MKQWDERPQDVSNLLNPAFLGLLLHMAVKAFRKETGGGMPYELLALVLPFVLHPATRRRLPPKITTTLPTWLQSNRDTLLGFPDRIRALMPFTREALTFLTTRRILVFTDDGHISTGSAKPVGVTKYRRATEEIADCCKRAEFVGRWLAMAGSSVTIFALLGIRP